MHDFKKCDHDHPIYESDYNGKHYVEVTPLVRSATFDDHFRNDEHNDSHRCFKWGCYEVCRGLVYDGELDEDTAEAMLVAIREATVYDDD
jgi:hypothetical protein